MTCDNNRLAEHLARQRAIRRGEATRMGREIAGDPRWPKVTIIDLRPATSGDVKIDGGSGASPFASCGPKMRLDPSCANSVPSATIFNNTDRPVRIMPGGGPDIEIRIDPPDPAEAPRPVYRSIWEIYGLRRRPRRS